MKLLPAPPQPKGLLPAPKRDEEKDQQLIEFYESMIASIDLAEELLALFHLEFYL